MYRMLVRTIVIILILLEYNEGKNHFVLSGGLGQNIGNDETYIGSSKSWNWNLIHWNKPHFAYGPGFSVNYFYPDNKKINQDYPEYNRETSGSIKVIGLTYSGRYCIPESYGSFFFEAGMGLYLIDSKIKMKSKIAPYTELEEHIRGLKSKPGIMVGTGFSLPYHNAEISISYNHTSCRYFILKLGCFFELPDFHKPVNND